MHLLKSIEQLSVGVCCKSICNEVCDRIGFLYFEGGLKDHY